MRLLLNLGREGDLGTDTTLAPYALLFGEHGREDLDRFLDVTARPADALGPRPVRQTSRARSRSTWTPGRAPRRPRRRCTSIPNTLRQRLERVAAVLPEFQDPTRILEIHMALRLAALRAPR